MNENSIGSVIPVKNETSAEPANNDATLAFCACPLALNQIATAIAGNPNIIVGKNPDWNVPDGLISTTPAALTNVAGACANTLMSPCTPPQSAPSPENHRGAFITWCNPNGISNLLIIPYAPISPAFPQCDP